jgi:hypothetical protein
MVNEMNEREMKIYFYVIIVVEEILLLVIYSISWGRNLSLSRRIDRNTLAEVKHVMQPRESPTTLCNKDLLDIISTKDGHIYRMALHLH